MQGVNERRMKRVHCESAKTKTTECQVLEQESRDCSEAVGRESGS